MIPPRSPRRAPAVALALGLVGVRALASDEVVEVVSPRADAPAGASVVDVSGARAADELGDVLAREAGLVVRSLGGLGAWTGVSLRGASFRQVQLHLDGVPLNPDGVDAVNLAELPLVALDAVWIFRGRVPATYGASPVGGLVDLRTAPARAGRVAIGAGSFGSVRVGGALALAAPGTAGPRACGSCEGLIVADLLGTRGDFGFFDDGGTVYTPDDDAWRTREANGRFQVAGLARWTFGRALAWKVLDAVVHRDEQLPGPVGAGASEARLVTTRNLAVVEAAGTPGPARLTGRGWHLVRAETLDDRGGEIGVGRQWQRDTGHTAGLAVEVDAAARPWLRAAGSATVRWERFDRVQLATGVGEPAQARWVGGAAAELGFYPWGGRLRLIPSVDLRILAPEGDGARVVGNPGLVIEGAPGRDVALRLAGGGVFRPPDLTELYGDRGAMTGNPALRPEAGWNADLSLAWARTDADWDLDVSAGGFLVALRDRITWLQNAQRTVVPVNLGESWSAGAELGLAAGWRGILSARAALTVTEARDGDGHRLPYVPPVVLDHALTGTWPGHLSVTWDLHVTDRTFVDSANLRSQPVRVLHGLAARVELAPKAPWIEVALRNLGDQRTVEVDRDPVGADDTLVPVPVVDFYGYPLPGRAVWVTMGWTPGRSR